MTTKNEFIHQLQLRIPKIRVTATYVVDEYRGEESRAAIVKRCIREGSYAGYLSGPPDGLHGDPLPDITIPSWSDLRYELGISWNDGQYYKPNGERHFTLSSKFRAKIRGFFDASHIWQVNYAEVVSDFDDTFLNPTPLDRFGIGIHKLKIRMGPDPFKLQRIILKTVLNLTNEIM